MFAYLHIQLMNSHLADCISFLNRHPLLGAMLLKFLFETFEI